MLMRVRVTRFSVYNTLASLLDVGSLYPGSPTSKIIYFSSFSKLF